MKNIILSATIILIIFIPFISSQSVGDLELSFDDGNKIIAKIFIAGPEYRNVIAGPKPAPLLWMPENSGRTVQEHTAKIEPETDATR